MPDSFDEFIYDESPCDFCSMVAICRRGAACAQFKSFVKRGGDQWRNELREPSVELYRHMFPQAAA